MTGLPLGLTLLSAFNAEERAMPGSCRGRRKPLREHAQNLLVPHVKHQTAAGGGPGAYTHQLRRFHRRHWPEKAVGVFRASTGAAHCKSINPFQQPLSLCCKVSLVANG